jgi:hypothetical protein
MLDSHSVISQATAGIVKDIATDYDVSVQRVYEMLGPQCVYPKTKRLIRSIGRVNPDGVRLIKADMDALFAQILGESVTETPTVSKLHKEAFEAIDSLLEGKSGAEQLKELRELGAVVSQLIEGREKLAGSPLRVA